MQREAITKPMERAIISGLGGPPGISVAKPTAAQTGKITSPSARSDSTGWLLHVSESAAQQKKAAAKAASLVDRVFLRALQTLWRPHSVMAAAINAAAASDSHNGADLLASAMPIGRNRPSRA
jgi:hypothetical protein